VGHTGRYDDRRRGVPVYIDENGAADDELKVTVGHEEYTTEEAYDLDHDGVDDSAVVETDDGGHLAFSDTDGDGDADLMSTFDASGNLVSQARFDAGSGEWIAVDPHGHDDHKANTSGDHTIVVDTKDGDQEVGPATEDTDGDGKADTAIVKDDQGDTWLFTDADGDGKADLATEITQSGEVTMTKHTGDDQWIETEHGHIDSDGKYVPDHQSGVVGDDSAGWLDEPHTSKQMVAGVVRIDSTTGQWISPN
jgi:hypothetical protein